MKNKHPKRKLAQKMWPNKRSAANKNLDIFEDNPKWIKRRSGIAERVRKQQEAAHARAVERKEKLKAL